VNRKAPLILLVEDDPDTAELYQAMLKAECMEVVCCHRIQQAVDWWSCSDRLPDVVVTDVLLPDGNGLEMLAGLEWPGGGCPPAVVLSAHGDPRMPARCRKAGGAIFLDKLKGLKELIPQIKKLIPRQYQS
jgi:two-component system nitrogen regulation response regulator GlnG